MLIAYSHYQAQGEFNILQKEADKVYVWLTSDRKNLKWNCEKDAPPYDWSDMQEMNKDNAIARLATSGTVETERYWKLAGSGPDSDNWIARWFIYHLFRHRDRRNRYSNKRNEAEIQSHGQSSSSDKQDASKNDVYHPQPQMYKAQQDYRAWVGYDLSQNMHGRMSLLGTCYMHVPETW